MTIEYCRKVAATQHRSERPLLYIITSSKGAKITHEKKE